MLSKGLVDLLELLHHRLPIRSVAVRLATPGSGGPKALSAKRFTSMASVICAGSRLCRRPTSERRAHSNAM